MPPAGVEMELPVVFGAPLGAADAVAAEALPTGPAILPTTSASAPAAVAQGRAFLVVFDTRRLLRWGDRLTAGWGSGE
jgi:hypothetical protein